MNNNVTPNKRFRPSPAQKRDIISIIDKSLEAGESTSITQACRLIGVKPQNYHRWKSEPPATSAMTPKSNKPTNRDEKLREIGIVLAKMFNL